MKSRMPSWVCKKGRVLIVSFAASFLLALSLAALWLWQSSAADVYLGISRAEGQKINMATVGFSNKVAGLQGENLNGLALKTLRSDMDLSAVISMVDPNSLPFDSTLVRPGREMEFLPRLSSLSIQVMLAAELSRSENKLILDAKLFDVSARQQILHNRYMADMKGLTAAVHRLSDDIIYYLTGERGICRTKLAFVSNKSGAKEIYLMDLDGDNVMQMTRNRSLNLTPRWSPDGRFLAYVSYRDGNPDLYLLDVTCGRRTKISSLPGLNISPAWSPDGKWMALALSKSGNTNLYLMRPDGGELRQITDGKAIFVSPTWSPNGRQIAFVSDQGGTPQIYVMDAEGTNMRRLTFQGNYNTSPAWSPKGDKIAFVSQQNGSLHIFAIRPDGGGLLALTHGAGQNESPSWSPDGRYIAFSSTRQGRSGIYIMREDGSGQRRLSSDDADYYTPDWSPR
ncbi:MAG: Tol-Pal system beta propeller repeat protein TolB [candidate division NC10 bacterium]|nr:Tol-Pal system beta propeller repeat protein TolB [candidate division NC10 bacterium]